MKNKYKIQEITFLEKINSMFILMNNISNINSESYIEYKMMNTLRDWTKDFNI